MKLPHYLLASALCLAVAIGACSDGPTDVSNEAEITSDLSAAKNGPVENSGKKKDKVDICHYDGEANGGAGALIHLNVDGNAWDGGGEGCGGKNNGRGKQTGHNGHEMDVDWNSDTTFVAEECEAWCYEDRDGDGWTDDVDNCIDTYNPGQEDNVHPNGIGDACDDPDQDGVNDDVDNCPDDENADQADNWGGGNDLDQPDGEGDVCDDTDGDGTSDANDYCQLDNTSDDGVNTDGDGWCDANDNCVDTPNNDQAESDGDAYGDACDQCAGDDDTGDTDTDGVCDDIDQCTGDDLSGDTDADGVCDDLDQCNGDDASGDSDSDGVCDDIDACPNDDTNDADGDGICAPTDQCVDQGSIEDCPEEGSGWQFDDVTGCCYQE